MSPSPMQYCFRLLNSALLLSIVIVLSCLSSACAESKARAKFPDREISAFSDPPEYAMPVLFEYLEDPESSTDLKNSSVARIAEFQQDELLDFYYQHLKDISSKETLTEYHEWEKISRLMEAIVFVDKQPDMEVLLKAFAHYQKKEAFKNKTPVQEIYLWWGAVITAFHLGETGDKQYIPTLKKMQDHLLELAKIDTRPPSINTRQRPWDITYFACDYAQRRINGEEPFTIIMKSFDNTVSYIVRRMCMNIIKELTGAGKRFYVGEGNIFIFPIKFDTFKKYYLKKRRMALENIGFDRRSYRRYSKDIILSDGTTPTRALSEEEIEKELENIERTIFPKIEENWKKIKPTLKPKPGITVMSILQKLGANIINEDYRYLMPQLET